MASDSSSRPSLSPLPAIAAELQGFATCPSPHHRRDHDERRGQRRRRLAMWPMRPDLGRRSPSHRRRLRCVAVATH